MDGHDSQADWDAALARLEEFLLVYPADRALPDPEDLVAAIGLPRGFLREDERARKIYIDALGGRPLSSVERVSSLNTEVELLTVEVEVIGDRLSRGDLDPASEAELLRRLMKARRRLNEINRLL
jgi:hypothetical protein